MGRFGIALGIAALAAGAVAGIAVAAAEHGSDHADRIVGTKGGDVLKGLSGHDLLSGGAGSDVLIGGRGPDTLRGGPGRDSFNMRKGVQLAARGRDIDPRPRRRQRRDQLRRRQRRRDRRPDRGRRLRLRGRPGAGAVTGRPRDHSSRLARGELADPELAERLESEDRDSLLRRREFLGRTAAVAGLAGLASVLPAETLVAEAAKHAARKPFPKPRDLPIDTFVVLMMENRSFDHYFGWHPKADGKNAGTLVPQPRRLADVPDAPPDPRLPGL